MEVQKQMEKDKLRAQNIKKGIFKYCALNVSANNLKGISKKPKEANPALATSMAFGGLKIFSENPNLLKRRRSQNESHREKKRPLDFEDLFNLKQKLIGVNKKKSSNNLVNITDGQPMLDRSVFSESPTKNMGKR